MIPKSHPMKFNTGGKDKQTNNNNTKKKEQKIN